MMVGERWDILEEEVIILQNSGEIPEIALHSTLYYLTQDEQGPQIVLQEEEVEVLQNAADQRYRQIVLRDLDPDNRDLTIYRGVIRSIVNWQRYQDFCRRTGRNSRKFKKDVGKKACDFICREYFDLVQGQRNSSVNCGTTELVEFLNNLDIDFSCLPDDWQIICVE